MPVSSPAEKRSDPSLVQPAGPLPFDPGPVAYLTLPSDDHRDAARRWVALLDAGLIPDRNPPAPPAIVAQREANEALFRARIRDRRRLAPEDRA